MSDLANQPERPARNYTTQSGQQRTITARPASSGITGFSAKHLRPSRILCNCRLD
ncbi:MAG: hypothetical protein ACTJH0_10630 [Psychrobacter sp.]